MGYQLVFDGGLCVDLGVGAVGFYVPGAHVDLAARGASSSAVTKLYPAAKINVGWAF